jgi:predicted component of viral defense system (DUF524 family)
MTTLFQIDTDLINLSWSQVQKREIDKSIITSEQHGLVHIKPKRKSITFAPSTYRVNVDTKLGADPGITIGPILYEQTNYKLFVQSNNGHKVAIKHHDPVIQAMIEYENKHQIALGFINFGSQIGRTEFSVIVDDQPEFNFEIEVFPSKLDYENDYQQILADIQDVFHGLAFEYLRSTYLQGRQVRIPQPTDLEWLILLRSIVSELERAYLYIAQHPVRNLIRENQITPIERIKKVDSSIRNAVRHQKGIGELSKLKNDIPIKSHLFAAKAKTTLDTPEHRWLDVQLNSIRQKVNRIKRQVLNQYSTYEETPERAVKIISELESIEKLIVRLNKLEPFDNVNGFPPPGFASIQLLTAPGYREAYRACSILSLGLRIEGGPLRLSVKDLNLLYEYWCYIALLRIVSNILDKPIQSNELLTIQQRGLQILLQKGRQCNVKFETESKRSVTLTYNPKFGGDNYLVPQQPDILMTLEDPNWPKLQLLFDAKYRIDTTQKYKEQYGTLGPPEDALNVLHRYRDAILEKDCIKSESKKSKRTIVQAAVLFPSHDTQTNSFSNSRLWHSLDKLGVGAVPLLPGETKYLEDWLRSVLHHGGWDLAERVIPHIASDQLMNWRIAASEIVLVTPLRPDNEKLHLEWIESNQKFYMSLLKQQRRQYFAKWIAFYISATDTEPGSIQYLAKVNSLEIIERKKIVTPWKSSRNEELTILYHLGKVQPLDRTILNLNKEGRGQRFSSHRWTSKLGLDRANILTELFLETEPEWRLYENLQANEIKFDLIPGSARVINPEDPKGRTKFVFENGYTVRYGGAAGFILKKTNSEEVSYSQVSKLIEAVLDILKTNFDPEIHLTQETFF